jgi:hypothetical protein
MDTHAVLKALASADFDAFESLTSRYARVTDMILQKLFRCLDAVELEDSGTLLGRVSSGAGVTSPRK